MKKIISKTKELAMALGFKQIVRNCKSTSTPDEIYGYILLMANYMLAANITYEQKISITTAIKLIGVELDFISTGKQYSIGLQNKLAA